MPYGLKTAPQTFQGILNSVFADFLYQWLIIYIDDVIVWANTDLEALSFYELVFECAAKFGIQFKPTKCAFFSQDLEILGHRVTPLGWFPTSKGREAISAMPRPHNVSSVKRFLGMGNYFCDYVRNMASCTKHLHSLLCKGTPFVLIDAHEAEFTDLKDALLSPDTMLYHPDWNSPFELHTDASKHGIGAMLAQWHNGKLLPVKFFHVLLQQWKVVGQPPTKNFLLSSIRLSISDPICLDTNSLSSQIMQISSGLPVLPPAVQTCALVSFYGRV